MLKQTERLKVIYTFLKQTPADARAILEFLQTNDAEISLRQLQRDFNEVEKIFIQPNEELFVQIGQHRKKIWQIVNSDKKIKFNQSTINTLYLAMLVSPNILMENRLPDIELFRELLQKAINKSENQLSITQNQSQLINTHFYEITKDTIFNANINQLISAVTNRKYIKIIELINDYTVDNHQFKTDSVNFAPVAIIYHRGAFLIAGIESKNQEAVIYEIGQLKNFKILDKGYNYEQFSNRIKNEFDKRFGITKNMTDDVYEIVLEFTSVTGALVSKYFWHHSQHFEKKKGNWIMTMKCGINRELMGWLFQWMYNVRILEPAILQMNYDKTLDEMIANRKNQKSLVYKNIFEPK
ncbi:WYL domain-containing protein [Flavobacterium sp. IMCC34518]|uniref:WYL domain-containing protein n=1 Tax=Flavobacterium sp. IMCC34518 TaxID=3003623 RepID=UPI0024829522|nr:WYL domain-containing protein [Flavobacterium sp. IMCC34518]